MRRHPADILPVEENLPAVREVEAGDVPQQSGLAAAARSEQEEKLARLDAQVDLVENHVLPEAFTEVADGNGDHGARSDGGGNRRY